MRQTEDQNEVIADPLQWQKELGDWGPNLKGAARFWKTVESLLGTGGIYRDGTPDCSEIIIPLKGNIGLKLFSGGVCDNDEPFTWIEYRFVNLDEEEAYK